MYVTFEQYFERNGAWCSVYGRWYYGIQVLRYILVKKCLWYTSLNGSFWTRIIYSNLNNLNCYSNMTSTWNNMWLQLIRVSSILKTFSHDKLGEPVLIIVLITVLNQRFMHEPDQGFRWITVFNKCFHEFSTASLVLQTKTYNQKQVCAPCSVSRWLLRNLVTRFLP